MRDPLEEQYDVLDKPGLIALGKEYFDLYISLIKYGHENKYYDYGMFPISKVKQPASYLEASDAPYSDTYLGKKPFEGENWTNFKTSLLKGTYWFFFVETQKFNYVTDTFDESTPDYYLREGNHRYLAYLELIKEGRLPEDFRIPVIFGKECPLYINLDRAKKLNTKVWTFPFQFVYCGLQNQRQEAKEIINISLTTTKSGRVIGDYVERVVNYAGEFFHYIVLFCLHINEISKHLKNKYQHELVGPDFSFLEDKNAFPLGDELETITT